MLSQGNGDTRITWDTLRDSSEESKLRVLDPGQGSKKDPSVEGSTLPSFAAPPPAASSSSGSCVQSL